MDLIFVCKTYNSGNLYNYVLKNDNKNIFKSKTALINAHYKIEDAIKIEGSKENLLIIKPLELTEDILKSNKVIAEYIDSSLYKYIRPVFDIDGKNIKDGDKLLIDMINFINNTEIKCELYNNVTILADIRDDKTSFHIHIVDKKISPENMIKWVDKYKKDLDKLFGKDVLDSKIYRMGETKLRTINGINPGSGQKGLKPYKNYNDNFKILDYMFQYTDDNMEIIEINNNSNSTNKPFKCSINEQKNNINIDNYSKEENSITSKCSIKKKKIYDLEFIEKLLMNVSANHADDYKDCVKLGYFLYREFGNENGKNVYKNFLKRSKKYSDTFCDNQWELSKTDDINRDNLFKIDGIFKWLKHDFIGKYKEMVQEYYEKIAMIKINDLSLAEYVLKISDGNFLLVFSKNENRYILYYWNDVYKIWDKEKSSNIKDWSGLYTFICYDVYEKLNKINYKLNYENHKDEYYLINKLLENKLKIHSNIEKIIYFIRDILIVQSNKKNNDEEIKFDRMLITKHSLQFRNGLLMLDKLEMSDDGIIITKNAFRDRTKEDYITQILSYDFDINFLLMDENKNLIDMLSNDIYKKIHLDYDDCQANNYYVAMALLGEPEKNQYMKIGMGYEASNGKTTEYLIHKNVLEFYCLKGPSDLFSENNKEYHKFITSIGLARLIYLSEINNGKIDNSKVKEFSDGDINSKVLYESNKLIPHNAMVIMYCNYDPIFTKSNDEGLLRRLLYIYYNSKFVENDDEKEQAKKKGIKEGNIFIANKDIKDVFCNTIQGKLAYIYYILPYIYNYINEKYKLPSKYNQNFRQMMADYDEHSSSFNELFTITNDENDRVGKEEFMNIMKSNHPCYNWKLGLRIIKFHHLIYKDQFKKNNKKGVILGLKINESINLLENGEEHFKENNKNSFKLTQTI